MVCFCRLNLFLPSHSRLFFYDGHYFTAAGKSPTELILEPSEHSEPFSESAENANKCLYFHAGFG